MRIYVHSPVGSPFWLIYYSSPSMSPVCSHIWSILKKAPNRSPLRYKPAVGVQILPRPLRYAFISPCCLVLMLCSLHPQLPAVG